MELQAKSMLALIMGRSLPETSASECYPHHPLLKLTHLLCANHNRTWPFVPCQQCNLHCTIQKATRSKYPFRVIKRELVPINLGQCRG